MIKTFQTLLLLLATLLISSCATPGVMQGVVKGSSQKVVIHYEQHMSSDSYTVQMPDGETFKGRAVLADNSATISNVFGSGFATGSGGFASSYGSGFGISQSSSGKVVATLIGDKGNMMKCLMQYASSYGYTTTGGVGVCRTNDGRELDVVW